MRPDIVAGAVFPDYELSDHTGKRRKLSKLQGQDPSFRIEDGTAGLQGELVESDHWANAKAFIALLIILWE